MRSIAGLLLLLLIPAFKLQAKRNQYGTIKGVVLDSAGRTPVEAATISVFDLSDSSLITYGITNRKGEFLLNEIPRGRDCRLLVSYSGLRSYTQLFYIGPDNKELQLPAILLRKVYTELEAVIVSRQAAAGFATQRYDRIRCRLVQNGSQHGTGRPVAAIAGVEDANGNITVNGKKVSKITVNGWTSSGLTLKLHPRTCHGILLTKYRYLTLKPVSE